MSKTYKEMSVFLMLYIVLQPVLDVVTGVMIHQGLSTNITLGIVVRMLAMVIAFFYILMSRKKLSGKKRRVLFAYIAILVLFLVVNLIVNYQLKPIFSLRIEGTAIAKMLYLPVMLVAYYIAFKDLFDKKLTAKYFPKVVYWAILVVDFVMIVAHFTNTNFNSYSQMKAGENGWFFAANEIGSLLAITLPIVLMFVIQQTRTWRQWYYWLALPMTIYSCLLLGTKAGILSIFATFSIAVFVALTNVISSRGKNKRSIIYFLIFCSTLVGMKVALPMVAASQNIKVQETYIKQKQKMLKYMNKLENKKHLTKDEKSFLDAHENDQEAAMNGEIQDTTKSLIFSSRTVYLSSTNKDYIKAPVAQKLFGMGVAGNYKQVPKIIEMDFFDLFYEFGIIGFVIVILPLIYALLILLAQVLRNWRNIISYREMLPLLGLAIGLGTSFIAGHVLMSPAVCIYLVVILSYLLVDYQNKKASN